MMSLFKLRKNREIYTHYFLDSALHKMQFKPYDVNYFRSIYVYRMFKCLLSRNSFFLLKIRNSLVCSNPRAKKSVFKTHDSLL